LGYVADGARGGTLVTSLDTLVPGGANSNGLQVGSRRYSDFAFRNDGAFNLTPADMSVRISNDASLPGGPPSTIQFSFGADASAGQSGSVSIDYRVDDLSANYLNRAGVRFGFIPPEGVGPGSASVTQTLSTLDGSDLALGQPVSDTETLSIFNDGPGRLTDSNSAFLSLNLTRSLRLSNEITLSARETGRLDVSLVNNFSDVPEPTIAALFLPTALALLVRRRRPVHLPAHRLA
jgi:hypothetical protein